MSIPVPFVSTPYTVEPDWADFNGHLNMAYYLVLFDRGQDDAFVLLGLGPDYVTARGLSTFTAECHIRYVREVAIGTPVTISFQILEADAKRIRYVQEMRHAEDGWLAATAEALSLHVDLGPRKVAPMPADVLANVEAMRDAHSALALPDWAGRGVAMRR